MTESERWLREYEDAAEVETKATNWNTSCQETFQTISPAGKWRSEVHKMKPFESKQQLGLKF